MTRVLYWIVEIIAKIHSFLITLNDSYEFAFTDKQLHFLVIGILGLMLVLMIYPVFKYLAKKNRIMTITAIYVFTLIVVITFAIEIGQKITHTGSMEFKDILYGVTGFCVMYIGLLVVIGFFKLVRRLFRNISGKDEGLNGDNTDK